MKSLEVHEMKLSEARRDQYRILAKKEGYRSRASYKLINLNSRYKVIKRGDRVIDFGCAPGGWLQVASKTVGGKGFVLGIDCRPVSFVGENVVTVIGDIGNSGIEDTIRNNLGQEADVVLSDIAPTVSGIWEIDHARQIDLTIRIISLFSKILSKKGSAVLKIFEGESSKSVVSQMKNIFSTVKIAKPPASRQASSEFYLVALGYGSSVES